MNWIKTNWGWIVAFIFASIPLLHILSMVHIDFSGYADSWIYMDSFTLTGRHPDEMPRKVSGAHIAVRETGEWAIRWLVIVLSLTPFSILTGKKPSLWVRQACGIAAFVYAGLHFLFFCVDEGWLETFKEPGYVLGLIATFVMLVLAITSNTRSMKLLRRGWKKLHRLAYMVGILAVLHVALLKHGDWIPYLVILISGFIVRWLFAVQIISRSRGRKTSESVLV